MKLASACYTGLLLLGEWTIAQCDWSKLANDQSRIIRYGLVCFLLNGKPVKLNQFVSVKMSVVRLLLLKKKKILLQKRKKTIDQAKIKKTRLWVDDLNRERELKGLYTTLIDDLRKPENAQKHLKYLRMTKENFDYILTMIRPYIQRRDTHMRKAIPAGLKLAITLHYLAEGSSFISIAIHYRIGRKTAADAIYETCNAIWTVLQPLYLAPPCVTKWKKISEQ